MQFARQIAFAAVIPMVAWCVEPAADDVSEQENPDFARYRTIIDRMPFGEPPPGFDPTQAPGSASAAAAATAAAAQGGMTEEQRTEEEKRLASSVRVSMLNVTPAGRTMVGFTDSSAKPPEHYYLPVGGERDGWTVKAADPATEKITLAKGEVEVTLRLGEGSTGDGKGDKRKTGGQGVPQPSIRRGGMMGARLAGGGPLTPPGAPGASGANGESSPAGGALARLRERRTRLMQEQQAEAARRTAAANEEKAENERREAEAKAAAAEAAAEREQQRAALLQIQEELRRQREEKERRQAQEAQEEQPEQQ